MFQAYINAVLINYLLFIILKFNDRAGNFIHQAR